MENMLSEASPKSLWPDWKDHDPRKIYPGERIYNGPHKQRAIDCLIAGREDAAISWMERDLLECECSFSAADMPMRGTLRRLDRWIAYRTIGDCTRGIAGDGI